MDTIIGNSMYIFGSGDHINVRTDNWLGETLLLLLDLPVALAPSLYGKVSSLMTNGKWDFPLVFLSFPLIPLPYQLVWLHSIDGDLSSKQTFAFLRPSAAALPWATLIWRFSILPCTLLFFGA